MQRANQEFKLRGTDMCSPRRSLRTSAPVIEDVGNGIVREPRLDNATMALCNSHSTNLYSFANRTYDEL